MASTLIVNDLDLTGNLTTTGDVTANSVSVTNYRPGEIIEYLTGPCDGSIVVGKSGSYTWPTVTGVQVTTTTYQDISGSSISYTPPAGAVKVIYKFDFMHYWQAVAHSIQHYNFYIDGNEIINARHNRSASYMESRIPFEWVINIGGVTDYNVGRLASWPTALTLKMQGRRYTSHSGNYHGTYYWNGAGSTQFSRPTLTIIAVA